MKIKFIVIHDHDAFFAAATFIFISQISLILILLWIKYILLSFFIAVRIINWINIFWILLKHLVTEIRLALNIYTMHSGRDHWFKFILKWKLIQFLKKIFLEIFILMLIFYLFKNKLFLILIQFYKLRIILIFRRRKLIFIDKFNRLVR